MKIRKTLLQAILVLAGLLTFANSNAQEADSTGLPGDHFSLQGALELFKKAATPEYFEKALNTESNGVNNLDLNDDGSVDYIRVINKREGDVQLFILQAQVSDNEQQDIAVIELEKTGEASAVAQITGDEDIFGEETLVEASDGEEADHEASSGPSDDFDVFGMQNGIVVNVWAWPSVRFVYAPGYRLWVSPLPGVSDQVGGGPGARWVGSLIARIVRVIMPDTALYRYEGSSLLPRVYRPIRVTSVSVTNRHRVAVNNYRVDRTVTKKTVTGPRGRQYETTRRTTTVHGKNGSHSRSRKVVRRKR